MCVSVWVVCVCVGGGGGGNELEVCENSQVAKERAFKIKEGS